MFVTDREEEFRDRLKLYISDRVVMEETVAVWIDISTATLRRFLNKQPVRKKTLFKVGQFLVEHESK